MTGTERDGRDIVEAAAVLLEMATEDQGTIRAQASLAQSVLKKLQETTVQLPSIVAAGVEKTLQDAAAEAARMIMRDVSKAKQEAIDAADEFRKARRNLSLKVWSAILGLNLLGLCLIVGLVLWWTPSMREIEAARMKRDELREEISRLQAVGAGTDWTRCEQPGSKRARFCVRLDEKTSDVWGDGYRLVREKK